MSTEQVTKGKKSIQELMEERLRNNAARKNERKGIEPVPRDQPIRASFAQERLWYFQQFQPNETSYNTRFVFNVAGPLNEMALKQTINELVQRHESLRTTIVEMEGEAFQNIHETLDIPLHIKHIGMSATDEETKQQIEQIANRPFDLERGPLFEVHLLRKSSEQHVLLFHMHHIVFDGWSVSVFMNDLKELYESFSFNRTPALEPLLYQYADFSAWQRKMLNHEQIEKYIQYWAKKLEGAPHTIELPYDKLRPPIMVSDGNLLQLVLSPEYAHPIRDYSKAEGATLFITLLTAFYILLYKYTGQNDILVGSPIAARTSKELESIIGFFVNMICLRGQISEESTFQDFMKEVKQTCLEAYTNQDLPFEKLIEKLQPERDLSRSPLFQVMFEVQHGSHSFSIEGLEVSSFEDSSVTSKYDLSLIVEDMEDGSLVLNFEYCTDLFEFETIERLGNNYMKLIEKITDHPHQKISEIEILSESEKHTLVTEWNETGKEFDLDQHYFQRFETQALQTPDLIAVADDNGCFTYRELLEMANRTAYHLHHEGVGLEDVVGLLGHRDRYYVASLLAVLKLGAVYVPIDPGYPNQRIQHILKQSQCKMLLLTSALEEVEETLAEPSSYQITKWEDVRNMEMDTEAHSFTPPSIAPHNLAYTIFTSGSTGVPKGSMIEQKGMMNHLHTKIVDFQLTSRDTIAQTASQSFDISVWQLLTALLVGGKVRIYSEEVVHDPSLLLDLTKQDEVTVMEATPAYLKILLEVAKDRQYKNPALKNMLVTGEQADSKLLQDWLQTFPDTTIVNAYGPSECADDVTLHHVRDGATLQPGIAPIGKAISNMRTYILDESLQVLPIGSKGEIYIGGVGVGRGYIHNPRMTASRYIPDPFSAEPGARLFRTGDLGRYRMDGTLEFFGRVDNQVKLRGFRIELEEIEANLQQLESIRNAAVTLQLDQNQEKQLVAYVVLEEGHAEMTPVELQSSIGKVLPKYMIPAHFVMLDAMPLSPNGKIDRKSLPVPEFQVVSETKVGVTTKTEEALAGIWSEVLGTQVIGKYDHFFEIGGHSLLGIQVIARVRKKFNIPIPVSIVFEAPTLEQMADYIDNIMWIINMDDEE